MQHDKTGAIFVFMKLIVFMESISTNLMDYYISEPLKSHRIWRITEPMGTGIKKGRGSWYWVTPAILWQKPAGTESPQEILQSLLCPRVYYCPKGNKRHLNICQIQWLQEGYYSPYPPGAFNTIDHNLLAHCTFLLLVILHILPHLLLSLLAVPSQSPLLVPSQLLNP